MTEVVLPDTHGLERTARVRALNPDLPILYRIRRVNAATGIITTVAGTATSGFNGDGILATSAQLNAPVGVAFDAAGDLSYSGQGVDLENFMSPRLTLS